MSTSIVTESAINGSARANGLEIPATTLAANLLLLGNRVNYDLQAERGEVILHTALPQYRRKPYTGLRRYGESLVPGHVADREIFG